MSVLEENIKYTKSKGQYHLFKVALLAIMGGFFIGLGYMGYFAIHSLDMSNANATTKVITKFLAAAIFPTGILMCVFLGGSLFTSDSMLSIAWVKKHMTLTRLIIVWTMVWIFNFIGSTIAATTAEFAHVFPEGNPISEELIKVAEKKAKLTWYQDFFSGILCNMLVAGSIFMANGVKQTGAKIALIWFAITLFVLGGFQHTVANQFVFMVTWIHQAHVGNSISHVGGSITNLVMSAIGNWVAGAVIIPGVYLLIGRFSNKKTKLFQMDLPKVDIKDVSKNMNQETLIKQDTPRKIIKKSQTTRKRTKVKK